MSVAGWVSSACVLALVVVLALVARDRNRLRLRIDNAEGAVTGLRADLDATRELLHRLQGYLGEPASWDVDAAAPPALTVEPDRWSPTHSHHRAPDGTAPSGTSADARIVARTTPVPRRR